MKIARAKVQQMQTMLHFAAVRAPFDGVITEKFVNKGDMAMPGLSLLKMENPEKLQIIVDVPEMRLPLLKRGLELMVHIPAVGFRGRGEIVEIAPAVNPLSHTARIKLNLTRGKGGRGSLLSAGMFARVELPGLKATLSSLFIDKRALFQYGQIEKVFVMRDNKASLRIVRSGVTLNKNGIEMVEILSGLEAGEKVLLAETVLHNLQPVRIVR